MMASIDRYEINLNQNSMMENAYRPQNSIETALVSVLIWITIKTTASFIRSIGKF